MPVSILRGCNPQPGHRFPLDVKFLKRIPGTRRLYQFTAIDDGTRIRVLKIYDACNQRSGIYIRPRAPRLNGKVERSHRVDDQEVYQRLDKDGISDEIHLFNDNLRSGMTTLITTARGD